MKCCICGPVKNCGPYLNRVFSNIEKLGALFDDYVIIMYYDKSNDNTLNLLKQYQKKNPKLVFYINTDRVSRFRTHNIAKARNFCLQKIQQSYSNYEYFIMMDCDDACSAPINSTVMSKYLFRDDWDALSFNKAPYLDIWGLSIKPFLFSYNHFRNNNQLYTYIQQYITKLLKELKPGDLLPCMSAFNGLSIYRTNIFINCKYDGRINLKLIPLPLLYKNMLATNSPVIYKDYGNVNGYYEECEHRPFHIEAINKYNARIMVSPEILFYS
jgi:hypothetical protein